MFGCCARHPLYWFRVPVAAMTQLRRHGFHDGYFRDSSFDTANSLLMAFDSKMPQTGKMAHLTDWLATVDRECSTSTLLPALFHPKLSNQDAAFIRSHFGKRLCEIDADTADAALFKVRLTKWRLGVFYHIAAMGHWDSVVEEHFRILSNVGLSGIHIGLLGQGKDSDTVHKLADRYSLDISIEYAHSDMKMYEHPSITVLEDWARKNDGYLLYFHTKGVSRPNELLKQNWRKLMNIYVIENWRQNVSLLRNGYDAVGTNQQNPRKYFHFPGNFWMATTEFIRTLPPFHDYCRKFEYARPYPVNTPRYCPEYWIGSGDAAPRAFSYFPENVRLSNAGFWDSDRLCQRLPVRRSN